METPRQTLSESLHFIAELLRDQQCCLGRFDVIDRPTDYFVIGAVLDRATNSRSLAANTASHNLQLSADTFTHSGNSIWECAWHLNTVAAKF